MSSDIRADDDADEELCCRVCRLSQVDDPSRVLFSPCRCSGSIRYVHQDCLELWLQQSRKDRCELCSSVYIFQAEYAEGSPAVVPPILLFKSALKRILLLLLPGALRLLLVVASWLVVVPLSTSWMYRVWMRTHGPTLHFFADSFTIEGIKADVVSGIVLAVAISMAFIILMSFADFLRFHWLPDRGAEGLADAHGGRNDGNVAEGLRADNRAPRPEVAAAGAAAGIEQGAQVGLVALAQAASGPANAREAAADHAPESANTVQVRRSSGNFAAPAHDEMGQSGTFAEFATSDEHARDVAASIDANNTAPVDDDPYDDGSGPILPRESGLRRRRIAGRVDHFDFDDVGGADASLGQSTPSARDVTHAGAGPGDGLPAMASVNDGADWNEVGAQVEEDAAGDVDAFGHDSDDEDVDSDIEDLVDDDIFDPPHVDGQVGDVEMHVAVDELLGLRGPLQFMIRNVTWFLVFNCTFIALFALLPCSIGAAMARCIAHFTFINIIVQMLPDCLIAAFVAIGRASAASRTLQLTDLLYIGFGYLVVMAVIFAINSVFSWLRWRLGIKMLILVAEVCNSLTVIVKVGGLLFVRIVVLPLSLGAVVIYSFNSTLMYTFDTWVTFITSNVIGASALAWVVGIAYMLIVTLSVLQLREVLHPDILAKFIRPQEAHLELLNSLMHESSLAHLRRICVSILVYLILLLLFVHVPVIICGFLVGRGVQLQLWYILPELQLPLELTMAHIAFLMLLEQKKNVIGRMQHAWFQMTCRKLGLSRFLLPFSQLKRNNAAGQHLTSLGGEEPPVGRPLRRPPPGWDARTVRATTRWAWVGEIPSEVEKSVAPRAVPSHWALRTLILILASWLVVVMGTVGVLIVPIALGRLISSSLFIPQWLRHDPVHFLLGILFAYTSLVTIHICFAAERDIAPVQQRPIRPSLSLPTILSVSSVTLKAASVALVIGMLRELVPATSFTSIFTVSVFLRSFLVGSVLCAFAMGLLLTETIDAVIHRLGLAQPVLAWLARIRNAAMHVIIAIRFGSNDNIDMEHLRMLDDELVTPVFVAVVLCSGLPAGFLGAVGAICATAGFRGLFSVQAPADFFAIHEKLNEALVDSLRLSFAIWCIFWGLSAAAGPARRWMNAAYQSIRDENYLIGRRLINRS